MQTIVLFLVSSHYHSCLYGKGNRKEDCLSIMASQLSEAEISKLKQQFLDLDEDGSGEITADEFKTILKNPKLKMSEADIDKLLVEYDMDGSGGINVSEFLIMMSNRKNKALKKKIHKAIIHSCPIRMAFNEFDKNGDGFITTKEFKDVMRRQKGRYFGIGENQLDAMVKSYDKDGDGKIDYEEFVFAMTS